MLRCYVEDLGFSVGQRGGIYGMIPKGRFEPLRVGVMQVLDVVML